MRTPFYCYSLKITIVIFILSFFGSGLAAQSNIKIVDDKELSGLIAQNLKQGHPECYGLVDQYTITVEQLKKAGVDPTPLINEINQMENGVSCSVIKDELKIIVKFPKPNNKNYYDNDQHLASLKALLASHNIKMTNYERVTCKK